MTLIRRARGSEVDDADTSGQGPAPQEEQRRITTVEHGDSPRGKLARQSGVARQRLGPHAVRRLQPGHVESVSLQATSRTRPPAGNASSRRWCSRVTSADSYWADMAGACWFVMR